MDGWSCLAVKFLSRIQLSFATELNGFCCKNLRVTFLFKLQLRQFISPPRGIEVKCQLKKLISSGGLLNG